MRPHRLPTLAAATALVAVALLGVPAAANAATIYPPTGSCTVSPTTIQAGGTLSFSCEPSTFSADENVTITVTGENGAAATIGMVRFAISTASAAVTSEADGSLADVRITLPGDARGTYNIAAVSSTSAGGTAPVTISGPDGLPSTGLDTATTTGLWIGGGALVLAGAALALGSVLRRRRDSR